MTKKTQRPTSPSETLPVSVSSAMLQLLVHSSRRLVPSMRRMAPAGITLIRPVRKFSPPTSLAIVARSNDRILFPVIMSNQSSSVYGGQVSGLFGLASGRATGNLSVSVVGGVFNRDPTTQSVTYGLALQPPNGDHSADAGTFHWLGTDSDSYTGDITWKDTTASSDSDLSTFEIDGWQFKAGDATVTNTSQNLNSAADPYYVNMFFPSQDAQLIRKWIHDHLLNVFTRSSPPTFPQTLRSRGHPPDWPTTVSLPSTSFRATPSSCSPLLSEDKFGR